MRQPLILVLLASCGGSLQVLTPPPNPFAEHDLIVTESPCPALADRCDQLLLLSSDLPPVVLVAAEPGEQQFIQDSQISADGQTVAFTRRHPSEDGSVVATVEVVRSVGNRPVRRELGPGHEPHLSRDGTRVALALPDGAGIDLVRTDGTLVRSVYRGTDGHGARLSPDGAEVAFIAGDDRRLWHVVVEGGTPERYGDVLGMREIAWDPQGERLLLATDAGVYLMDRAGTSRVPRARLAGAGFVWSGDGQSLAFLGGAAEGRAQLLVSSPPGAAPHALTDIVVWGNFSWSPDDDWIAYSSGATTSVVRVADGYAVAVHESRGVQRDPLWAR